MAYAWNSTIYYKEAIKYLKLYVSNPLYNKQCVSNGTYTSKERTNIHLCEMYCYLGSAYESNKEYDKALSSYYTAHRLCPNLTRPYLKIANIYSRNNKLDKAIKLLEAAKATEYAIHPDEYTDYSKLFISIPTIDKHLKEYKERLYIETTYPYSQKQIREIVSKELQKDNILINFTQPKLAKICDYFKIKKDNRYFYKYPKSKTYRCSQELANLLVNTLLQNNELIDYFSLTK